jgi:hypothetical protein
MPIPEPTGASAVTDNAAIARLINHSGPDAKAHSVFQRGSSSARSAR